MGYPGVLLFDEPVNGLDVDGVRWVRHLVRDLDAEGRTVQSAGGTCSSGTTIMAGTSLSG